MNIYFPRGFLCRDRIPQRRDGNSFGDGSDASVGDDDAATVGGGDGGDVAVGGGGAAGGDPVVVTELLLMGLVLTYLPHFGR